MSKPRVAFVGRVPHEKTRSDLPLINLLEEDAAVTVYRRESMSPSELVRRVNDLAPQHVVFYQLPPSFSRHLLRLRCKSLVWVPMWDGFKPVDLRKRLAYRHYGMRVLCFCRRIYDYIRTIRLDALYAQYFPAPVRVRRAPRSEPPYTIFLWQRDPALGPEQVVQVLGKENIAKVMLKTDAPAAESAACAVENIVGWLPEDDYLRLLEEADFCFAPRFQEGIGFSFLEPMAHGIPVIGHDDATMNEYIRDGETSLLFDRSFRLRSGLVSPAALHANLTADFDKGYENWRASIPGIKSFIMNA